MKFLAVDVETANSDCGSICQVGIAAFENNSISDTWKTLVNPQEDFSSFNVSIHGINQDQVLAAPTFEDIFHIVEDRLKDQVVLHHTAFDKRALSRAAQKYDLELFHAKWLDTAKVVRRTWEKYSVRGYSLKNVARDLGISFNHHDALEDAIAAGKIMVHALKESGLHINDWLERADKPLKGYGHEGKVKRPGNLHGPLSGHKVVFTGSLSLSREEVAREAAARGCDVADSVTKATTLLVVGVQDLKRTRGARKSSKLRKAEALIDKGHSIAVLCEEDFLSLLRQC